MKQLRAVIFLPDDDSSQDTYKPLMLEPVLFCPVLTWASKRLQDDGVRRFFVFVASQYQKEARSCLDGEADVTVSCDRQALYDFLAEEGEVIVIPCPVIPSDGAGEGYVYQADALELKDAWEHGKGHAIASAKTLPGFMTLYNAANFQEAEQVLRGRIVSKHIQNGVRILDPAATYIDPRVEIGPGTMLLPGTILKGNTRIGASCTIGPNAMVKDCTVGDGSEINASQTNDSTIGRNTHIGPFAYIRPGCTIGDDIKVGDFVEVKNSVVGNGTKISHLTYVGDSDVGERVNFGCGTITTNYDGFKKSRCTIGNDVFIGCNTNLVAPVSLGDGSYVAAGATLTQDVPADALAVARVPQTVKEGWAARNRKIKAAQKQEK